MAELVDDSVADLVHRVAAGACDAEDRPAEDGDLIGKVRRAVAALGHRDAAIDTEELVRIFVEKVEILAGRLFLDDDGDVVEQGGEPLRQLAERLLDELLEVAARDADHSVM